jgi:uncharacterized phosphosugar-binding protein
MAKLKSEWIQAAKKIIGKIENTQGKNIEKAAELMADSIAGEHWVHMFGVGHAHLPLAEVYPRSGGYVGFHPIGELAMTNFLNVVGSAGVRQFCFLERVEGYATQIMSNYEFSTQDTMWIFSHSGINAVVVEAAIYAKNKGMKLVATTSLQHSKKAKVRHSSGKKLYQVADVVIDSCVPHGDSMISLPGLEHKVGPGSTLGFITVANAVVVETAKKLLQRGVTPLVNPTANLPGDNADEIIESNTREYQRRLKSLL